MTQGITWNIFWGVVVNTLNPGLIFFSGSVFVSNIMEKRVSRFSWIFSWNVRHDTEWLIRLFHAWQKISRSPILARRPVSKIAVKWVNVCSWNFQDMSATAQGITWIIFGMVRLTLWIQGLFSYFWCPCVLVTWRHNKWMNIHEIFRIWTQVAGQVAID